MWRIHRGVAPLLRDNAAEMSSCRRRFFEFWTKISTSRTRRSFSATEASLYVVYGELLSRSRKYLSREGSRSLRLADPFLRTVIGRDKNGGRCYGWRIDRFEIEVSLILLSRNYLLNWKLKKELDWSWFFGNYQNWKVRLG